MNKISIWIMLAASIAVTGCGQEKANPKAEAPPPAQEAVGAAGLARGGNAGPRLAQLLAQVSAAKALAIEAEQYELAGRLREEEVRLQRQISGGV